MTNTYSKECDLNLIYPNYDLVREQVKKLREKNYIYSAPVNAKEIAKKEGLQIVFAKFGSLFNRINGFLDFNDKIIIVNSERKPYVQNFTIAHELGHWLLHNDRRKEYVLKLSCPNGGEDDPMEKEANTFAAELLVPMKELMEYKKKGISNKELAKMFFVSEKVIEHRLENCVG